MARGRSKRGFAAMSKEEHKKVSALGGSRSRSGRSRRSDDSQTDLDCGKKPAAIVWLVSFYSQS